MYNSIRRCSCCDRPENTQGCVVGFSCYCIGWSKEQCPTCKKCEDHCSCMTVGRVMLAATKGEVVPKSCVEDGKACNKCVSCARSRIDALLAKRSDIADSLSKVSESLNACLLKDLGQILVQLESQFKQLQRKYAHNEKKMKCELTLREPEPMWSEYGGESQRFEDSAGIA